MQIRGVRKLKGGYREKSAFSNADWLSYLPVGRQECVRERTLLDFRKALSVVLSLTNSRGMGIIVWLWSDRQISLLTRTALRLVLQLRRHRIAHGCTA